MLNLYDGFKYQLLQVVSGAGNYGRTTIQYQNWPLAFGIVAFLILLYIAVRVILQAREQPDEWVEDED